MREIEYLSLILFEDMAVSPIYKIKDFEKSRSSFYQRNQD
jgi:hypothetical protein